MANTYIPFLPLPVQFQNASGDNDSGGLLEFFLAGTSTPTNLFSDNTGTSIGTSITLNALGMPESGLNVITLFRQIDVPVKVRYTDAASGIIATPDNLEARRMLDVDGNFIHQLTQVNVGAALYPVIPAWETDIGVTPVNLFYPFGNVLRNGADRTGVASSAIAFQDCVKSITAAQFAGNTGVYGLFSNTSGSTARCVVPFGIYNIDSTITTTATGNGVNYIRYVGDKAILVNVDRDVDCFTGIRFDVTFEGIIFRGFDKQVSIATANTNSAQIQFVGCHFQSPKTNGIITDSNSASTQLDIDRCKFFSIDKDCVLMDVNVDWCSLRYSWLQASAVSPSTIGPDILIINRNRLFMDYVLGVPGPLAGTQIDKVWVENRGLMCHIQNSRLGGENGGRTWVRNKTPIDSVNPVNPVTIIIERNEAYAFDDLLELDAIPNQLTMRENFNETQTGTGDSGIKVNASLSATEVKDFARFGRMSIDDVFGRNHFYNNDVVALMATIKNLKNNRAELSNTRRVLETDIISSGDHSIGFATSTTCTASASADVHGAVRQKLTCTADGQSFSNSDADFLIPGELSKKAYTMVHMITYTPVNGRNQQELLIECGHERYIVNLIPGTHAYSTPFVYLNGGGASADTDLDKMLIQTGPNMNNGDVIELGRWFLLEDIHKWDSDVLEMIGTAVPGAIAGTVGPNLSYFRGDIQHNQTPTAATTPGWMCTTAGNPGTFSAMAALA